MTGAAMFATLRVPGFPLAAVLRRRDDAPPPPRAVAVPRGPERVSVDIDLLNKTQLIHIIRERIRKPLRSLQNMNAEDLRGLLSSLGG